MIKDPSQSTTVSIVFWDNPWTNRSHLWLDKNVIGIRSSPVPDEFLSKRVYRPHTHTHTDPHTSTTLSVCSVSSAGGSSGELLLRHGSPDEDR